MSNQNHYSVGMVLAGCLLSCKVSAFYIDTSPDHTQNNTLTLELEPSLSSKNTLKIARAIFLPETFEDLGYSDYKTPGGDHNRGENCKEFSYSLENCKPPYILQNKCPFGTTYAKCFCEGSPDCTGKPSIGSSPYPSNIGASQNSCKNCKGEALMYWTCNPKYSSTSIPDKATAYEKDCAGNFGATACSSGYEPVNGRCSPATCSGFNVTASTCECLPQSETCLSGTVLKYKSCTDDLCDPCKNYYSCSGSWQYCTETTCSDGTKRCSSYCTSDYFPYSCSLSSRCYGIYRNGYCSVNSCCNGYNAACDTSKGYCNDTCKSGSYTYYKLSSCKLGYGLTDGDCFSCGSPAPGHILYADFSTCSFKVDDKTPIAVVVDAGRRSAIALERRGPSSWSDQNYDIPGLKNYSTFETAATDFDGPSNTQIILSQCGSAKCRSAELASNYSIAGVSGWYLPAEGELYTARQNMTKINSTLNSLGKTNLIGTPYSSTEISYSLIWLINFSESSSYYTSSKNSEIDDTTYPFIRY